MVLFLMLLMGCSARYDTKTMENNVSQDMAIAPQEPLGFSSSEGFGGIERDLKEDFDDGALPMEDVRKIIKSGDVAIEIENLDDSYEKLAFLIKELDGEEFSKNYYAGEIRRMELVIKIPPNQIETFEMKLRELVGKGRVKRLSIKSQDITDQYIDIKARLDSFIASRNQLQKIMEDAKTVEETLSVHRELTNIQAEIESFEAQINLWDRLVKMATVNLTMEEMRSAINTVDEAKWRFTSMVDVGRAMKNGFINVVNVIYSGFMWMLIFFVSLLPVLVPLGLLGFIIYRRRKKKKKSKDEKGA